MMTREDILALKPGRDLDALVAEHACGWIWVLSQNGTARFLCDSEHPAFPSLRRAGMDVPVSEYSTFYVPHYSTDDHAGLDLLKLLAGKYGGFLVAYNPAWALPWHVTFALDAVADAETLAVVACRAAVLLANQEPAAKETSR